MVVVLAACSEKPKPEDRFAEYVSMWNEQDFNSMYERISSNTKEKIAIEDFTKRYENIYSGIEAENVKITFNKPKEEVETKDKEDITFPYNVSMETIAGKVEFTHEATLVKEELEKGYNWFVQWDSTHIFPQLQEGQEVKVSSSQPVRGEIYDRNGNPLAQNGKVYEVGIEPGKLGDEKAATLTELSSLLQLSIEEIEAKLNESWVKPDLFVPIKKIDPNNQELAVKVSSLQGVFLQKEVSSRYYPLGESAAHLIGYVQTISAEQLEKLKGQGYTRSSKIGKVGLEQVFEDRLRGETGWKIYIPNGEVIAEKPAESGENITLTIDAILQANAYSQLKGDAGSVVAIHPKTGETLALVSSPSYNPNDFIFGMSNSTWKSLNDNPLKPLMARFNKTYAPGSTLKPLTAAIGLATGITNPEEKMTIEGKTWAKDNWGGKSITRVSTNLTSVNLNDALVTSDNIYFARTALAIGNEKFEQGLQSFGFGDELVYEFPTTKSTISNNGFSSEGLLADSGYGQGEVQMSPIHLSSTYSVFVNNGSMIKPYLEKKDAAPVFWKENIVSPAHAELIYNSLYQVVNHPQGTGYKPVVEGVNIAGKTGTAELKVSKDVAGEENGWFVAVNNEASLLITMMVENVKDRGGSHYAVPKVKELFR
ncbi:penicillin-binding transpeptidase domain-containing protein [Bacillus suaedaesalsae]|nr:penicillin-binding transpeptidase domain-containing protein [Bacillus suaedaesalsae]